jgi:hypothetical protein
MSVRAARLTAAVVMLLLHAGAYPTAAQSLRVSGATSLRYIELRPLVRDSIAAAETVGSGLLRQLEDGRVVRCVPGEPFCSDVRPGGRVAAVPLTHDIEASAWGFGRGMRVFAQARVRSVLGGSPDLWPRGADEFELLAAYAQLDRERLRVRAGRQWKVSGLGFYNFDGLAVSARAFDGAWVEAYTGRSLLRGLNEPRTGGALASIDALAPPAAGLLFGVQAQYRHATRLAVSGVYQVDFRADGRGLYSELLAGDGVLHMGAGSLEARLELDAASGLINEARLRARTAPIGPVALYAEVRRYRPYFELWTIWGAFSPVGFDEAQAGITWTDGRGRLLIRAEAAVRSYDGVKDGAIDELRSDGWSLRTSASWEPVRAWRIDGSWRMDAGVGAARRDGHAGVSRQFGDVATVALQAVAFQRLYEFRLNEGTVLGIGAETTSRLSERTRVAAGATVYRHFSAGSQSSLDWNQRRAHVRLQWLLGREPSDGGFW